MTQSNTKFTIGEWKVDVCHQVNWKPFKPFYGRASRQSKDGKRIEMFNVEGNSIDEVVEKIKRRIER